MHFIGGKTGFLFLQSFQSKLSFGSKEIVAISCSWCKEAFHNKDSCFNMERYKEHCSLGKSTSFICILFYSLRSSLWRWCHVNPALIQLKLKWTSRFFYLYSFYLLHFLWGCREYFIYSIFFHLFFFSFDCKSERIELTWMRFSIRKMTLPRRIKFILAILAY